MVVYGIYNNLTTKFISEVPLTLIFGFIVILNRGTNSNLHLQNSISSHGLSNFTLYIFTILEV